MAITHAEMAGYLARAVILVDGLIEDIGNMKATGERLVQLDYWYEKLQTWREELKEV